MDRIDHSIVKSVTILAALANLIGGCGNNSLKDDYASLPIFERAVAVEDDSGTLQPARLRFFEDTLFVSYAGESRIDLFTPDLDRIKTVNLTDPEPVYPTAFDIADSAIYVTDHAKHIIVVYGRDGSYIDSFGSLPDGKTALSPFALTYFGGVLYVTDIRLGRVLAVSMVDASDITEKGELILSIPDDSTRTIKMPSAVMVTFDGRLLAGDAGTGEIVVFTCDGRFIYAFDSIEVERPIAPQGFAMDNIIDPSMQDSLSFDPSGIRRQGRFHAVDANNAAVHMFNPLGRYVASYPAEKTLIKPSDIAIDRKNGIVYIADPGAKQILVYRYGDR
jgi:DNA-binding beta-propeller fold protein YncE